MTLFSSAVSGGPPFGISFATIFTQRRLDSAAAMRMAGPDLPPRRASRRLVRSSPCSGSAPAWHLKQRARRIGSTCASNVSFFSSFGDASAV